MTNDSKMQKKRILICTFVALVSGFFGVYVGGQINRQVYTLKCQTQPWGLKTVCQAWVLPGAVWQGSTTGLFMGWIVGGLLSGLATRSKE